MHAQPAAPTHLTAVTRCSKCLCPHGIANGPSRLRTCLQQPQMDPHPFLPASPFSVPCMDKGKPSLPAAAALHARSAVHAHTLEHAPPRCPLAPIQAYARQTGTSVDVLGFKFTVLMTPVEDIDASPETGPCPLGLPAGRLWTPSCGSQKTHLRRSARSCGKSQRLKCRQPPCLPVQ